MEDCGFSARGLSLLAGISESHVSAVVYDLKRAGFRSDVAYRIAYDARISLSWLIYETEQADGPDIPKIPPPSNKTHPQLQDDERWLAVACEAILMDRSLDWAIMAVGEERTTDPAEELSAYYVLHLAKKLARQEKQIDAEERTRFDQKARAFNKVHLPKAAPELPTSGKHKSSPPKR